MSRDEAINQLKQLKDRLTPLDTYTKEYAAEEVANILHDLIDIYIADLQADDRNNGADE